MRQPIDDPAQHVRLLQLDADLARALRKAAARRWDRALVSARLGARGLADAAASYDTAGAALLACTQALFGDPLPAPGQGPRPHLYACELETTRAEALRTRCQAAGLRAGEYTAVAADAFQLTWSTGECANGIDLLWLNPP